MGEQFNPAIVEFHKDAYIFIEGEKDSTGCFYIILEGKVRISKEIQVVYAEPPGSSGILGPGDLFGIVSAMLGRSHIDAARALTYVKLISVRKDQFCQLIQSNTTVAVKIVLQLSKRLRYLNEVLAGKQKGDKKIDITGYDAKMPEIAFTDNTLERTYLKNAVIFPEGEPGDELFIIKSGAVKIAKAAAEGGEILLAILQPGDIFGEMALMDASPRTASAIAYENCQLRALSRDSFEQMIKTQPVLIARITTQLAERIWYIYKKLSNTLIADPVGRMHDMLLINLEKKQVSLDSSQAYSFDFGTNELTIMMVGLSRDEGEISLLVGKLLQSKYLGILDGKIFIKNVAEFAAQAAYYRKKMQKDEKTRKVEQKRFMQADGN
ncbi:MAG: cyclic nucleotide-binding domain-containing protein [Chitinispirillales bacterium]|jgi:CRP-like cAMP-binding protein|nr:cyclic nucleotide-binding domain-containing protein [Chitinispirillales bacterium]